MAEDEPVAAGQLLVVLEAMKMEQPVLAHRAGVVKNVKVEVGAVLPTDSLICEVVD